MSAQQREATALLCRLLEYPEQRVHGKAVFEGEWSSAANTLLAMGVLIRDEDLSSATCYDCWIELARVVEDPPQSYPVGAGEVLQMCPQCGPVVAPAYVRQTYRLALPRLITRLLVGLDFSPNGMKAIDQGVIPDERAWQLWRLGTSAARRGQGVTWYFARQLHRMEVAWRLHEQIAADRSLQSCVILTSSDVPLPRTSPLSGFDVRSLLTVGQIEAHSFAFFADRHPVAGVQSLEEAAPGTTLRYVKPKGLVYIDGQAIKLEPRERMLLMALIDDRDHEMDRASLRDKVGSVAEKFSPSKVFGRKPHVYRTFIRYRREDDRYQLLIPPEDRGWLI